MDNQFKVGDVVRLKSFGPYMVVSEKYKDSPEVKVLWHEKDNQMTGCTLHPECLVIVPQEEIKKEIDFINAQKAYQSKALKKQMDDFDAAVAQQRANRSGIKKVQSLPKA